MGATTGLRPGGVLGVMERVVRGVWPVPGGVAGSGEADAAPIGCGSGLPPLDGPPPQATQGGGRNGGLARGLVWKPPALAPALG